MPAPFKNVDQVIREGFQQSTPFIPIGARKGTKDELAKIQTYDDYLRFLKEDGKLPDDLADTVASSTLYGFLEFFGIDPTEWMFTIPKIDRENVKYGPEELEDARKFLGTWTRVASTALWVAGIAAVVVAFVGGGLAAAGLATMGVLLRRGASAKAMSAASLVIKLRGIKWLSVPAAVLGMATLTGFFAQTQVTATGDILTYLKQGVARGVEATKKAEEKAALLLAGGPAPTAVQPKTIIRMVEEKKPEQFIGTLFSAKLGSMESFNRHVDDEITDEADLIEDVKLNLTKWLATLPGRLGYSVVIRKNPVDEFGVKQSGTWATLTTHFTRLSGPIQPIDTILLGPVSIPARLKITKTLKTIEQTIPGLLTGQQVMQVEVPGGAVDIFDVSGDRVDLSTPRVPPAEIPKVEEVPTAEVPVKTKAELALEQGIPLSGGVPVREPLPVTPTPEPRALAPSIAPAPAPPAPALKPPVPATPPAAPDFNVNEFENGVRGEFITDLGVFENQILRVNTGGGNLNARASATTTSAILFKIPNRTTVVVDRFAGIADGFDWAQVHTLPGNKTAFVAAEFLEAL